MNSSTLSIQQSGEFWLLCWGANTDLELCLPEVIQLKVDAFAFKGTTLNAVRQIAEAGDDLLLGCFKLETASRYHGKIKTYFAHL